MNDFQDQLQAALGDTYTIEYELGGGGMSRVYLATDQGLGRSVVVKVLPAESEGTLSVERFRREIRVAASLQQANIVPVLAAGVASGVAFYTMPYVRGASLRSYMDETSELSMPECVAILRDVARALAFAHAEGIVHRDIKPENILLSGGTAVVTDFGIAKAIAASAAHSSDTLTGVGIALGTPAYMAPEQVVGESVDHRADLYALGVVAYEMLTGATPFAGRSAQAQLAAHVVEAPPSLDDRCPRAPKALRTLVMQCLEKERDNRPGDATQFLAALESATTSEAPIVRTAAARSGAPSIAVLPFESLSGAVEDEYFAAGLADEIMTDLSSIQSIRVIARASVSKYRGGAADPSAAARELGVSHVLAGSVRRAGDSFRLTLRLMDGATGASLWSDKLGGKLDDVFGVQETLSRTVVDALRVQLTPDDAARLADRHARLSANPAAVEEYLKGRHFFTLATADGFANALESFRRATELDPYFAAAFAGLANVYTFMTLGYQALPPRETMPRARAAATRAIQLDPRLAEAHVALGRVATFYDWNPQGADAAFREAIRLNGNYAEAHSAYAQMLTSLEPRFAEALDHARRALALNPIDPWSHWYVGFAQYFGRDYEGRIETHRRLLQLHPNWGMAHFGLGIALSTVGRPTEATACHLRAIELDGRGPNHVAFLGVSYALSGNTTAAHACLAELEAQEAKGQSVWGWKLMLHAVFNSVDDVIGALERAFEERSSSLIMQLNHPFLDSVRNDERYHAILRRMGLDSLVGWRPQRGWSISSPDRVRLKSASEGSMAF